MKIMAFNDNNMFHEKYCFVNENNDVLAKNNDLLMKIMSFNENIVFNKKLICQ